MHTYIISNNFEFHLTIDQEHHRLTVIFILKFTIISARNKKNKAIAPPKKNEFSEINFKHEKRMNHDYYCLEFMSQKRLLIN